MQEILNRSQCDTCSRWRSALPLCGQGSRALYCWMLPTARRILLLDSCVTQRWNTEVVQLREAYTSTANIFLGWLKYALLLVLSKSTMLCLPVSLRSASPHKGRADRHLLQVMHQQGICTSSKDPHCHSKGDGCVLAEVCALLSGIPVQPACVVGFTYTQV